MRIVSFAWTSPALVIGVKTCTRRDWDHGWAAKFKSGDQIAAYDRSPRFRGNHIATLSLVDAPRLQPMRSMPDSDYESEGFAWLLAHPEALPKTIEGTPANDFIRSVCTREGFEHWRNSEQSMYVIRFELVELTHEGDRQRSLLATGVQHEVICANPTA